MSSNSRKIYDVVIIIDYYLPGRKSGGPVTTISNMVSQLGDDIAFLVITQNCDIDGSVYQDIETDKLIHRDNYDIIYLKPSKYKLRNIMNLIKSSGSRTIYLNSFFALSTIKIVLYNYLISRKNNIILASRGEFSPNALKIKAIKKTIYTAFFRSIKMSKAVKIFHASSQIEKRHMLDNIGQVSVKIAPDMTEKMERNDSCGQEASYIQRVVFMSRIARMKNLAYLVRILSKISPSVGLDVYGPIEDEEYWKECEDLAKQSGSNVDIVYRGVLSHEDVNSVIGKYKLFVLPTLGENYGHAIFEALASGCPVIISDNTPWLDLEAYGVGWAISLEEEEKYVKCIEHMMRLDVHERRQLGMRCKDYAFKISTDSKVINQNLDLFRS